LISIFIIEQQQSHVSLVTGCRDHNNQGIWKNKNGRLSEESLRVYTQLVMMVKV